MDAQPPKVWKWCDGPRCNCLQLRIKFRYWNEEQDKWLYGRHCQPCVRYRERRVNRTPRQRRKVSTKTARQHIKMLRDSGMGRRRLHELCGVNDRALMLIGNGKKKNILKRTENRILRVTPDQLADGAQIDSEPTRQLVTKLKAMGISRRDIARRMGSKAKVPQLGIEKLIMVHKAMAIENIYNQAVRDQKTRWRSTRSLPLPVQTAHLATTPAGS